MTAIASNYEKNFLVSSYSISEKEQNHKHARSSVQTGYFHFLLSATFIMSSIVTAVFKATIGLLINKARDKAAEKLKEGDVTDEKFRSVIVREIDQINSKLDGLARKDLLSSISAFKEGISILFDVFKQANRRVKELRENVTGHEEAVTTEVALKDITEVSLQSSALAQTKAVSLAKELGQLQIIDLDESSKKLLSDAKERFKEARSKARDAFSNEGLDTADRILAMMVRVMATILDNVDNPRNALTPCRVCLEELHALPAVKKSFKIALAKGLKSWFGKDERKEIIAGVCDINHAIFDVTHMAGSNGLEWPLIDVGAENVHPLRDPRVTENNQQSAQYNGYYSMQFSFGADILKSARGICTNTKDQFIVGDAQEKNIKVFDRDGNFHRALEVESWAFIRDVATDQDDNVYILYQGESEYQVRIAIFDEYNNQHRGFVVDRLKAIRLTIVEKDSKQVLVLGKRKGCNLNFVVDVYEENGTFVRSLLGVDLFSGEDLYQVSGITACNDESDGRVMVLASGLVYVFSAEGDFLHKFIVSHETNLLKEVKAEAILWTNTHIIIVSICRICSMPGLFAPPSSDFDVSIYTEDGELVHHFPISSVHRYRFLTGVTMNRQGRVALALLGKHKSEVLVF